MKSYNNQRKNNGAPTSSQQHSVLENRLSIFINDTRIPATDYEECVRGAASYYGKIKSLHFPPGTKRGNLAFVEYYSRR